MKKTKRKSNHTIHYEGCSFESAPCAVNLNLSTGEVHVQAGSLTAARKTAEQLCRRISRRTYHSYDFR